MCEVGKTLTNDGAIVVFVNTWKWDGSEDVFTFVNRQLLESISKTRRFKPATLLLRLMLFSRRHPRKIAIVVSAMVGAISAAFLIDWGALYVSVESLPYKAAIAAAWAAVAGLLARPFGTLFERAILPKQKDVPPGEQLSKTYAYLMLSSRLGIAKKSVVFLFDDLDRCDEPRVVQFMQSIHRLTSQGSISVIACDDRFVASAIYHHYKNIADTTGEGKGFGERFLEKTVQVHFRMPNLDKDDLQSLGLHSGDRNKAPAAVETPAMNVERPSTADPPESLAMPTKDVGAETQTSVDEASLIEICGDVLSTLITPYRLSIRRAKFLSNLVKLYSMVFQPKDDVAAYRLAAFLMITHVDREWIPTHFARGAVASAPEDEFVVEMMRYLGTDFDAVSKLYAVCGIEPPGRLADPVVAG
ncbi:MAG: hypothetical protein QOH04_2106 [Sphingomonadales bacterium]|nr:hypothetical protein [Sphingomonadales bacterium]